MVSRFERQQLYDVDQPCPVAILALLCYSKTVIFIVGRLDLSLSLPRASSNVFRRSIMCQPLEVRRHALIFILFLSRFRNDVANYCYGTVGKIWYPFFLLLIAFLRCSRGGNRGLIIILSLFTLNITHIFYAVEWQIFACSALCWVIIITFMSVSDVNIRRQSPCKGHTSIKAYTSTVHSFVKFCHILKFGSWPLQ